MDDIKRIHHYNIVKIFKNHKALFPCPITRVNIKKEGFDKFSFAFINENNDVTAKVMEVPELLTKFTDAVAKINNLFDYNEEKYFEPRKVAYTPKVYLDKNVISELRNNKKLSVPELSHAIDLNHITIYSIERGDEIDTSIKTLVNYSLFFKKAIYRLFLSPYKNEIFKIILNDFIVKNYLTEEQAKEILTKEATL